MLESPMWAVLRGDSVDLRWVDESLERLSPLVGHAISLPDNDLRRKQGKTMRPVEDDVILDVVSQGGFHPLAVLVLLVKKSELIASAMLRDSALQGYRAIQPQVAKVPWLAPLSEALFLAIDLNCKDWAFPYPDQRLDIVMFSSELKKVAKQSSSGSTDDHERTNS